MPALFILLALTLLLILILRYQFNAFVAMLLAGLALGLIAGLSPGDTLNAVKKGIGEILRDVTLLIVLGALLGKMLEASGAAEAIASKLLSWFGERNASLAILVTGLIIGIPVIFGVGFLLLIPIIWRLQRQTGQSMLWFLLPMGFSLGVTHSLIPPKPGIVFAVTQLGGPDVSQTMMQTILFGTALAAPVTLIGWLGLGRLWAKRQFVTLPEHLASAPVQRPNAPAPFLLSLVIVLAPLVLSLLGFTVDLLNKLSYLPEWFNAAIVSSENLTLHTTLDWLLFLGRPEIALLVPTGLAFWLMGSRRGLDRRQLAKIAGDAIQEVAPMVLLFGAAGGFKGVIEATHVDDVVKQMAEASTLPPLVIAYVVAALIRIALGSATAAIATASPLLLGMVPSFAGREVFLVLAVANGVTFMTQPADSGFWMIKEYGNLSVRDVFIKYNACRIFMSLLGLGFLLLCNSIW